MSNPGEITKGMKPREAAMVELIFALSSLASPPEHREEAEPEDFFLVDTDKWAHHAAEHIHAAIKLLR